MCGGLAVINFALAIFGVFFGLWACFVPFEQEPEEKHIAASTEFWAGKLKLTKEELSAVEVFAKKKGKALDEFFSVDANREKIEALLASSKR